MSFEEIVARLKEAGMNEEAIWALEVGKVPQILASLSEATWDAAYMNDLPDSAFLHIAAGGEKDDDGKTMPRSLRFFPVYDSEGKLDLPHLRNALARIPQSKLDQAAKSKAIKKAQTLAKKNLPNYKEAQEAADESHEQLRSKLGQALRDRMGLSVNADGPWVKEVYDDYLIYELGGKTYQLDYSEDAEGKITVGDAVEVVAKTVYEPVAESIGGDVVPLEEKAVGEDGTTLIKVIEPGWGSSGYYSKPMLERDVGIYKAGTKMYWDHPTESEDKERPERSLRDLAGETISPATFLEDGPRGPGIYAKAKVFGPYREAIEELAPHIGLSHRVLGKTVQGEAEGKKGPIVEKLVAAKSIDYVTTPGAGGETVQLFEAARGKAEVTASKEKKESDDREEAKRMADEKEMKELKEAKATIEKEKEGLAGEVARLKEAEVLREAHDIVAERVGKAELPDVTKERLIEALSKNPTVKEGELDKEEFGKDIDEAIKSEIDYIAKITKAGEIRGMGSSSETSGSLKGTFKIGFLKEGFSEEEAEKMAETAAKGR